jgi:Predicted phosphatase homologous to the C-terminal domain of histone macroH2A1
MERTYKYNNSEVTICIGNILNSDAEVIVSSDDCFITMGGGVSASIRRKEGMGAIEQDVKKKVPAEIGDVVVSTAGTLPQKYIFHAITIGFIGRSSLKSLPVEEVQDYIIRNSVTKCLNIMRYLNVTSIAFPTIGGGTAQIPYSRIAYTMSRAISDFLKRTNVSYKVFLYIYDQSERPEYIKYLDFYEQFAACVERDNYRVVDEPILKSMLPTKEDYDLFISYSRMDSQKADEIADALKQMNLKFWVDRTGEYSGRNYKSVIVNTIRQSQIVLFLSSENSNKSENVIKEVSVAVELKKMIIPIKLDNFPYADSIAYDLTGIDYVNYESEKEQLKRKIISQLTLIKNSKK